MPRIFDNIDQSLLPALRETLGLADHADFCVGYFNLRGWKALGQYIDRWFEGPRQCCRLLVGMQRLPQEDLIPVLRALRLCRIILATKLSLFPKRSDDNVSSEGERWRVK
jgi:hypothetical protein